MFAARSTMPSFAFLLIAISSLSVYAQPLRGEHGARAADEQDDSTNARFTFFYASSELNSCGSVDHDTDFSVHIDSDEWDGGAHCNQTVTVQYGGKSASAKITDQCPGCPLGGLDLTVELFTFLAGSTEPGVIQGSWFYSS
ncbi:hypothetical protein GY45DRAFT_1338190 [Cubamyces sp. BRFM 1775]|nr:hypothetical protein GY45DRAFT_1338190 [Cubamyces sp. BRFM 1775]